MRELFQEFRHSFRALRKRPAYGAAAVATFAIGMGAGTAVFSVLRGVLLRPLPYSQPDRLVSIAERNFRTGAVWTVSPPNFFDFRSRCRTLDGVAAFDREAMALTGAGDAEQIPVAFGTADLFPVLGVRPALGRAIRGGDCAADARVVVLSDLFWRRRFNGDPSLIGRSITLDGLAYTVVGVMPPGFRFPSSGAAAWLPLTFGADVGGQRGAHYLGVVARLRRGSDLRAARAELETISADLRRQFPRTNEDSGVDVVSFRDRVVGDLKGSLALLTGAVALIILLACVNVSNLALATAASRTDETAVRAALGAPASRLALRPITESLILGLAGGIAAVPVGLLGVKLLLRIAPADLPRLQDIRLDGAVAALTLALGMVCGIISAILPAWGALRADANRTLRESGRNLIGGGTKLRPVLVGVELLLAVVLLQSCGALLTAFLRLRNRDAGFDPRGIVACDISLPGTRYATSQKAAAFFEDLLDRVRSLPQVASASVSIALPMSDFGFSSSFTADGGSDDAGHGQVRGVSEDYFKTLGIPLRAGRSFSPEDREGSVPVILASESAARRFFGGRAIGHTVRFGARWSSEKLRGTIVGVVGDVRDGGLAEHAPPIFYVPMEQAGFSAGSLAIRSRGNLDALIGAVRQIVRETDPNVPLDGIGALEERVSDSIGAQRLDTTLVAIFALIALLLAGVGINGVVSVAVEERTREIGIRRALGARSTDVYRSISAPILRAGSVALLVGLAVGSVATRWIGHAVPQVIPGEPRVILGVAFLLGAIAVISSFIPAARAIRVDPMSTLREQ